MNVKLPVLLLPLALAMAAAEPPKYQAGRALDAIAVDGQLTEFTWQALPRVGKFTNIRGSQAALTQAALAWDDENLYVAFVCVDPEPWGTMRERDAHLWEQEVVEVFLDPTDDGKNYAEIEVSPHNVVVDLLIPAPGAVSAGVAAKWDAEGMRTAVGRHAEGWTVEMSIPWRSLGEAGVTAAPKPGDVWRVGLYRIERPGGEEWWRRIQEIDAQLETAVGAEKAQLQREREEVMQPVQYLAWSPTERSFHEPKKFGYVEFVSSF